MSMVTCLFKVLVLVALIINGTAARGMQMLVDPATGSSHSEAGSPLCHSAASHVGSAHGGSGDSDQNPAGDEPAKHECGSGCTCACLNHSPPLAFFAAFPDPLASTPSMPTAPRAGFHSLTPLPLLRPPIG